MIRILATIRLYTGVGYRQTPFTTGYRPLFNFVPEMKTSGHITLLDRLAFFPGEQWVVEIGFLSNAYLGTRMGAGTPFTFGEGRLPLGEGEVIEILDSTAD